MKKQRAKTLTPEERLSVMHDVLALRVQGASYQTIATKLGITKSYVGVMLGNLRKRGLLVKNPRPASLQLRPGRPRSDYTNSIAEKMCAMQQKGMSYDEIALYFSVHKNYVGKLLSRWRKEHS